MTEPRRAWPTLYKKNENGSLQEWTISVEYIGPDEAPSLFPVIVTRYGQVGGKLQVATDVIKQGKNLGRANATTADEQAVLEAEAKWTKKKKGGKGYVESMEAAEAGEVDALVKGGVKVMCAETFGVILDGVFTPDRADKMPFPCLVQPKLDGIRCAGNVKDATLWSRERNEFTSVPHIAKAIAGFFSAESDPIFLDGELYNHAYRESFSEIVSLVKRDEPAPGHEKVEFHLFDVTKKGPYWHRRDMLRMIEENLPAGTPLKIVETIEVYNFEELMAAFTHFRELGYEGVILRNPAAEYQGRRTDDLQKLKEFFDQEFPIVAVLNGRGKMADKAKFSCALDAAAAAHPTKENTFTVKLKGPLEFLKHVHEHPEDFVGKELTVRHQGFGSKGKPRFPVGQAVRDYE